MNDEYSPVSYFVIIYYDNNIVIHVIQYMNRIMHYKTRNEKIEVSE